MHASRVKENMHWKKGNTPEIPNKNSKPPLYNHTVIQTFITQYSIEERLVFLTLTKSRASDSKTALKSNCLLCLQK